MTVKARHRLVNPRLGIFFGIFASSLLALVLLLLVLEQLGLSDARLRQFMIAGPVALYIAIGLASFTSDAEDFLICGRRVPEFFNGLVIAVTALSGTGYVAFTGSLYFIGFDALCLGIGVIAGLLAMAVLIAPYFRKFGAYTVPGFLGRRFESRALRLTSAALLTVPLLLLTAAELRMGGKLVSWSLGVSETNAILLGVLVSIATLVLGGMRSLTWANVAQCIAMILGLMAPITIVSVLVTNLPVPQLTYSGVMMAVSKLEMIYSLPTRTAAALELGLPGEGVRALVKPFLSTFGAVGPVSFLLMIVSVGAGVAAMPSLLARSGTTPGVYESRKSMGWAVFVLALLLLTLPAVATFAQEAVLNRLVGTPTDRLPDWFKSLVDSGAAHFDSAEPRLTLQHLRIKRDAILMVLPLASGFPTVLTFLLLAGALAALLATGSARILALANILAEDVVHGLKWEPAPPFLRLMVARVAIVVAAVAAGALAIAAPTDPLYLFLWALTLTASSAFPVLVLSVWWKRTNASGALAGMIGGFVVAALCLMIGDAPWFGVDSALAATFGMPAGFAATVIGSLLSGRPGRHVIELVAEIRMPGGETIHDRELRLLRLQNRPKL